MSCKPDCITKSGISFTVFAENFRRFMMKISDDIQLIHVFYAISPSFRYSHYQLSRLIGP